MSERNPPIATAVAGETNTAPAQAAVQELPREASDNPSPRDGERDSRPVWLRTLRWLAHGWWKLFAVVIVGNFVPGAVLAALQGGVDALRSYVTTWGLLRPVESSYPLAFWLATVVLAALAVVGLAAEIEERRRAARSAARLHQTAREAQVQSALAQATAQHALEVVTASVAVATPVPQPLGPPDDVALLPAPERFVGRADDLAWLEERLRAGGGGVSAITALRGLGGIGKTALAAVAVRALQREGRFPDGIAVVLCQQLSDPAEVLRRVLIRFDPYRRAPEATELPRLQDTAQATLRGKQALVVLDGVEPELAVAGVVAPLRNAGLTLLLTARQTLPGDAVPAEASHALELLRPAEALALFTSALGRGSLDALTPAERSAAEQIVAALGHHTLAVKLAGAYAAAERRDLASLASELADPAEGLALPGDDETPKAVRRSFALSLDALQAEAQRLFAGLAAFATTECGRQAALALGAALGQQHPAENLHLLLVRALVEPSTLEALSAESDRERLRLHPLLRALAEELYAAWPSAQQDAASLAAAHYLAGYAEAHQTDLAVLAADEGNLTGALEWAQAHDQPALVADLAHGMREFWDKRGRLREGTHYLAWGVAAAGVNGLAQGNPAARKQAAELDLGYGRSLVRSGRLDAGETMAKRSLDAFRAVRDRRGEGAALSALGDVALVRGHYEAAVDYQEQVLAIVHDIGDRPREGAALGDLGQIALWRGQLDPAEGYLAQAQAIHREIGDQLGEGATLSLLGQVALYRGQYKAAEDYVAQAVDIDSQIGDRQGEAIDLSLLGDIVLRRGDLEAAVGYQERALAIAREVGDRQGEGAILSLLGRLALRREQFEVAKGYLEQGLAISREVGDQRWEARSLCVLGHVAEAQGHLARAEGLYRQSLTLAADRGTGPEIATAQFALGLLLAERLDRRDEGCPLLVEAARRFGEMGMPEAEEARAAVARLGCA